MVVDVLDALKSFDDISLELVVALANGDPGDEYACSPETDEAMTER